MSGFSEATLELAHARCGNCCEICGIAAPEQAHHRRPRGSLEPLREPLQFDDLSMFDWVVIGAQTATTQPDGFLPAFAPEFDWVVDIYRKAREAGCKVHFKPNIMDGKPGMRFPDEYPTGR